MSKVGRIRGRGSCECGCGEASIGGASSHNEINIRGGASSPNEINIRGGVV